MSATPAFTSVRTLTPPTPTPARFGVRSLLRAARRRWPVTSALTGAAAGAALLMTGPQLTPQTVAEPHFASPMSLIEEHAELRGGIEQATRLGGQTAEAARQVLQQLDVHMAREQRHAFPLLRLLPAVSNGRVEPWMDELLPLGDRLREEMPMLAREHGELSFSLKGLYDAAWAENHPGVAFLTQRIVRHHHLEDQVLYPAALVVVDRIRAERGGSR